MNPIARRRQAKQDDDAAAKEQRETARQIALAVSIALRKAEAEREAANSAGEES